jgi:hypothetical protein
MPARFVIAVLLFAGIAVACVAMLRPAHVAPANHLHVIVHSTAP